MWEDLVQWLGVYWLLSRRSMQLLCYSQGYFYTTVHTFTVHDILQPHPVYQIKSPMNQKENQVEQQRQSKIENKVTKHLESLANLLDAIESRSAILNVVDRINSTVHTINCWKRYMTQSEFDLSVRYVCVDTTLHVLVREKLSNFVDNWDI